MSRPLRIALVHHLGPGGALRAAGALSEGLAQLGHDLRIYALGQGPWAQVGTSPMLSQPHGFYPWNETAWPKPWPLLGPALRARWQSRRIQSLQAAWAALAEQVLADAPDVVWAHHDRITQAPFALACFAQRVPVAYQCHEPLRRAHEAKLVGPAWWLPPPRPPGWKAAYHEHWEAKALAQAKALDRKLAAQADLLLANSRFSAESLLRAYGREATWLPMGVDAKAFLPPQDGGKRQDAVLVVGRLSPLKGQHLVVDALGLLPEGDRPELWLLGDSGGDLAYKTALLARANALGLKLRLEEDASEHQLLAWCQRAQMMVAPMILEPFGLVALEAQACGTPVVAVAEGGLREAVQDGLGGLWASRDAESLAQCIQKLRHNPQWAEALGRQGRDWVGQSWSWTQSAQHLEKALLRLLKGRAQRPS